MNVLEAKLNFSFICDYASVSREGKLSIMGIFENINARVFPVHHPLMYVVANAAGLNSGDRFTCELVPEDDQGRKMAIITSEVKVDSRRHFGFIGQFVNVKYDRPGRYLIKFYVDNKELGVHGFIVQPAPAK